MTSFQLLSLLMISCCVASPSPGPPPPCRVVQMDAFCSEQSLSGAPPTLPHAIQMLDLSRNQVQNLSEETLAYRTSYHHLNLRANKIDFIQPGLFRDMTDLKVLDLSRNHLNMLALSKVHIGPLTSVQDLDLSGNGLYTGMSDYFLSDSPALEVLSLSSNSITKLERRTFRGASSLMKINLHNNVILEIEDGTFDPLDFLSELDLSKNSISCITDFNLCHLKVLNLSQNSMELFHSTRTSQLFKLSCLDLSQNKMSDFPLLPPNNVLEHLDVSRNQLQSIEVTGSPHRKVFLNHLRYLDMSYNQLQNLTESFFYCMGPLEVLNVSNNCIRSFSITSPRLLQNLKTMDLSQNSLQSLTLREHTLPSLEEFFLQGNQLTILDHQIFQRLPNIRNLQLQQNQLHLCGSHQNQNQCVSFCSIPNLHILSLSQNHLRTLPADAFLNTSLQSLDLSLNPGLYMDQHAFSGLEHSLVHLLLRENNISSLDTDLSTLSSLKHVDLSTNRLTTVPVWTRESSIESLNLQNNHLVTLESRTLLALEHSLKTLYMGSNPLSCCGNRRFLHMVQQSGVVVPDLETVTCVHHKDSAPVNIDKVTQEMCDSSSIQNHVLAVVLVALLVITLLALLLKCFVFRKRKQNRSFST